MDVFFMRIFIQLLFFLGLTGCTAVPRMDICQVPPPLPSFDVPGKIRVALVLGGGGGRGFAHIGVIEELVSAGIPIDLIVGCSAGSIVGSIYADSMDPAYVRRMLLPCCRSELLDISLFWSRNGFVQGRYLEDFLKRVLRARRFDQLQIPLIVTATDIISGEHIVLGGGDLISSVKASSAVPVMFNPVVVNGRLLVDGGLIDPVPVKIAKEMGAEFIIAVPLFGTLKPECPENIFQMAERTFEVMTHWQNHSFLELADVIIKPNLAGVGVLDDQQNEKIYLAGRQAAWEALPLILEKLASCKDQTFSDL